MPIETASLADRLAAALQAHHSSGASPKAFDGVARGMIGPGETPDTVAAAAVHLMRVVQDTWDEDTRAACKFRKIYHRAYLRGLLLGAVENGVSGADLGSALARASVPVAYEEAIPLAVYAYSIGYGFGQAWGAASRDETARKVWLSAVREGVDAGEIALRQAAEHHGQMLDPDLAPPAERAADKVEPGFHLGSLAGLFAR